MSPPLAALLLYCGLIILASLLGGVIPMLVRLTHRRMEIAVSAVAGVMMGVGLLHLLPHAFTAAIGSDRGKPVVMDETAAHEVLGPLMLWLLGGFMAMFLIERYFCFHHHDAPPVAEGDEEAGEHEHHGCEHHQHHTAEPPQAGSRHRLTWAGAAIGLSLHSLIEGVALAASLEAGRSHGGHEGSAAAYAAGLGTFLVIALHKPFDSMTLGALMHLGERSMRLRHVINVLFALLVPVGAGLFHLGLAGAQEGGHAGGLVIAAALAFSAGTFLCIATSDLLPELQFHSHDRGKLSLALLIGLGIAFGISRLEARLHGHDHFHEAAAGDQEHHDHDHAGHDHDH